VNPGPAQLAIILVIVLVLFGGAKLPQLARSLGEAQKEFRKGHADDDEPTDPTTDDPTVPEA
jgi:sec-independent protein translocase protein TatA